MISYLAKIGLIEIKDLTLFRSKNNVLRSIVISKGSEPALFVANLLLYYYVRRRIRKIEKSDMNRAWWFANVIR